MKLFPHSFVSRLSCCTLALATLLGSQESRATSITSATIASITVDNVTGNAYIRTTTTVTGTSPSCIAAGNNNGYSFSASAAAGKNLLSTLTAALLANRPVFLQGFGSGDPCLDTSAGKFETLATVRM